MVKETYGSDNLRIIKSKSIWYDIKPVQGDWSYVDINLEMHYYLAFEYHRYCEATYEYVGMSESAAKACQDAMLEKYNRDYKIPKWSPADYGFIDLDGSKKLMADVSMKKMNGCLYSVTINVKEEDVKMSLTPQESASAKFSAENNREYEG